MPDGGARGAYRLGEAGLIVLAIAILLNLPLIAPIWRLVVTATPALVVGALPLIGLAVALDVAVLNGDAGRVARRGRSLAFRAGLAGLCLGTLLNFLVAGAGP